MTSPVFNKFNITFLKTTLRITKLDILPSKFDSQIVLFLFTTTKNLQRFSHLE